MGNRFQGGLIFFMAILSVLEGVMILGSNVCDDWINYKSEKCWIIMDKAGSRTKQDAEEVCRSLLQDGRSSPRLVTIKNKEQQEYLHQLLMENKMVDSVWLGLTINKTNNQLEWNDGSKLEFSNLVNPNMTKTNSLCVAMNINETGLWSTVSCTDQNGFVCERDAVWQMKNLANFQQDSNQTEIIIRGDKDCTEDITNSNQKTELLKEAAEKAIERAEDAKEAIKDVTQVLKDATQKIADYESDAINRKQFNHETGSSSLREPNLCGNWKLYKDEKCIKVFYASGTVRQEDAENVCRKVKTDSHSGSIPRLLTIKSMEEQKFLEQFLFVENEMVNNVWIGLKKKDGGGVFEWMDGTEVEFSNWANQTLADDENPCVEMKSGDAVISTGLWFRVSCKRNNAIVCEKRPTWTLETLQNSFLNFKITQDTKQKELEQKQEEWKIKQEEWEQSQQALKQEITTLKQNPVPIGFIYVQLAEQEPPTSLWPTTKWIDVSSNYSGLFFRVAGGNAAQFGQTQEGSSPRLAQVEWRNGNGEMNPISIPPDGRWSQYVYNGASCSDCLSIRFRMSTEEVRPRNQAIRIWQRIL